MSDDYFDLFVWYYPDGRAHSFQLCYDKEGQERAVTWIRGRGLQHHRVDTGEALPTGHLSPILIPEGDFPRALVLAEFARRSGSLDPEVRELVLSKLTRGGLKRLLVICSLLFSVALGVFTMLAFNRLEPRTHKSRLTRRWS